LFFEPRATDHHRGAEHKQKIAENRTGERGLYDVNKTRVNREDADDEFRCVAKGDVQQSSPCCGGPRRELFRRLPDEPCERHDRKRVRPVDADGDTQLACSTADGRGRQDEAERLVESVHAQPLGRRWPSGSCRKAIGE